MHWKSAAARAFASASYIGGVLALLGGFTSKLQAQSVVSVPFPNGFIGTRGSSAGTGNNVLSYATLGIARTFFIQSSSTNTFELQGNDIPGTLRIVRTSGATLDIPASANWRNSGGTTSLIGILPRPSSPITFAYSGGSIQITDGAVSGGSSVGGYIAGYTGSVLTDGSSTSGNAAQSQVLSGLNSYLSSVVSSRPAGPVAVNSLSTTSTTPTITGSATLAGGENLSVVVNGMQYTTTTSPAVSTAGTSWSLALTSPLAVGTYSITATVTNSDGFTLSDATSNELVITSSGGGGGGGGGGGTVTIGGSFSAANKTYDGSVSASGITTGLTLVGVTSPDQVTIASVTLAFQSAAAGTGKTVIISGVTLGGAQASSYSVSLAGAPTASADITAKSLTIAGISAASKTYDGNAAATLNGTASYVGLAGSESFSVSGTPAASFGDANIGTAKSVTVTGYSAPSSNYSVTQPTGLTANITAKGLTIGGSFTAANKPYDGTTTATIATNSLSLVGVVGGESVSLGGLAATFADPVVSAGKIVSITAATLGGASSNYTLSLIGAPTTTANIVATSGTVTIAGTFTASGKPYDGTTVATGNTSGLTLSGVGGSDQVSIASVTLAFQTPTAGATKSVAITGVTLGGADAARYAVDLTGAPTATAAISTLPLSITGVTAANKVYDGTIAAPLAGTAAYAGLLAGESFSVAGTPTSSFATSGAGANKPVTVAGYAAPNANYTITQPVGLTATITAKPLTIGGSFGVADKVYDGTAAATISTNALTLVGIVSGETTTSLSGTTAAFADPAVGAGKMVTLSAATLSGTGAANYSLSLIGAPTATANITTAGGTVTIAGSFAAQDKVYDGAVVATGSTAGLTLVGVASSDHVTIQSATLAFQSSTVGAAKTVVITGVTLGGANGAQYSVSLTNAPATSAAITAKPLTLGGSFTVADKMYDSTTAATITTNALTLVGVVAGDTITLGNVTAAFADATAGSNKPVTITNANVNGSRAANYSFSIIGAPTTTASITPASPPSAPSIISGVSADATITLTWTAPTNAGCGSISGYAVEYTVDGGSGAWQRVTTSTPATTLAVSKLVNGVPYRMRVAATNACGVGAFSAIGGPFVPAGVGLDGTGSAATTPLGTASATSGGVAQPTTIVVQHDSVLSISSPGMEIQLRAIDQPGAVIPIDSSRILEIERGGQIAVTGSGFKAGTFVSLYLVDKWRRTIALRPAAVQADGSFSVTALVDAVAIPDDYTLQVIGVNAQSTARVVVIGVQVTLPPAELSLASTLERPTAAVGDTITITLIVTNRGRGPGIDVNIPRAFTEPGFSVIRTTPIDGTFNAATETWTIPRIDPGASARMLLTVVILPPATPDATPSTSAHTPPSLY